MDLDTVGEISLDLLELFKEIHRCGSISAAARRFGISPSIATRRLAALERTLGVGLFQRTTRKLRLTEEGRLVLNWAGRSLGDYAAVVDEIAARKGRPAGVIRIALSDHAAAVFLSSFLERFSRDYPEIRFVIATTDHLVNPIEHGYDVVLHAGVIPQSNLIGIQIRPVERILCASPAYLAQRGVPRHPEDLASHACLSHLPSEPTNWYFKRDGKITEHAARPAISADSYLALIEYARRSLGILRISISPIREDLRQGRLVRVLEAYECVHQNGEVPAVWILYPDRRLLLRTRLFIDEFADHMRQVLRA